MQDTELYRTLQTLKPLEIREFRLYLTSPFFNSVNLYVLYLNLIVSKRGILLKKQVEDDAFIKSQRLKTIKTKKDLYNCRSKILTHLENFILQKASLQNSTGDQMTLAQYYRTHGLKVRYDRAMRTAAKLLETSTIKNSKFLYNQYLWQKISFEDSEKNMRRTDNRHLESVAWSLDEYYLSEKLMYSTEMVNRSAMLKTKYEELIQTSTLPNAIDDRHPVIVNLSIAAFKLFNNPEDIVPYLDYYKLLCNIQSSLSHEEKNSFYLYAFNYCVRQINVRDNRFEPILLDLIGQMNSEKLLVVSQIMNPWVYKNIIQFYLTCDYTDRAVSFWQEYSDFLPETHKVSVSFLAKAQIALAQKDYNQVFFMAGQIRYIDPHLVVSLKLLACKAYLQLDDRNQLEFHLEAFAKYLRYHEADIDKSRIPRLQHFLSICRKLNNLPPKDETGLLEIMDNIQKTPNVIDAPWLIAFIQQKLSKIKNRGRNLYR